MVILILLIYYQFTNIKERNFFLVVVMHYNISVRIKFLLISSCNESIRIWDLLSKNITIKGESIILVLYSY